MSINEAIAQRLEAIAQMLEVLGEDAFRVNAHARAARAVAGVSVDLAALDKKALTAIDGIGPKTADKIIEFVTTGEMQEHLELRKRVPRGVIELLDLPGVGPKTVQAMWKALGVDSIARLTQAIDDGSLRTLPRMSDKAIEKIKSAVALAAQGQQRLRLGHAWCVAQRIVQHLRAHPSVHLIEAAGSLRRGRETVGDIDVVVGIKSGAEADAQAIMQRARTTPGVQQVLVTGPTKTSLRISVDDSSARWGSDEQGSAVTGRSIQADVRVVPQRCFGAALQYFTGSLDHNVRLRTLAQQRGWTLNEWGLFEEQSWEAFKARKFSSDQAMLDAIPAMDEGMIAGAIEAGVYQALGVAMPAPEQREDRGEFDLSGPLDLVSVDAIKAELHAHTTASDGALSIEQLARAAHARGFHTIAVTDHSQSSTIAGGLRPDRLRAHIQAVKAVDAALHAELGIRVLCGSEVDILADGSLDYDDELLEQLDVVVASPHAALSQEPVAATKRLLKAIAHPLVHIIGHPTGRLILRRAGLDPALPELLAAAKQHDTALEINAHWMRLDLRDTHVRAARDAGVLIAINCDVHELGDFDNVQFGVATARRGWLEARQCINTWPATALHAWLKR